MVNTLYVGKTFVTEKFSAIGRVTKHVPYLGGTFCDIPELLQNYKILKVFHIL